MARAEELGAKAAVIYNSADTMFTRNGTSYPQDKLDYECSNGAVSVDASLLASPLYSRSNDEFFTPCSSDSNCASDRCVVTGPAGSDGTVKACCMWDLHQYMYPDSTFVPDPTIPSVFITSKQADDLLEEEEGGMEAVIEERPRPKYNLSSIIIWAWGTFVACVASYISASELMNGVKTIKGKKAAGGIGGIRERGDVRGGGGGGGGRSSQIGQGESLDLSATHAFYFVIISSTTLIFLFFVNAYAFVTFMYAFGCGGAFAQVILHPLLTKVADFTGTRRAGENVCCVVPLEIGPCSYIDVIGTVAGYAFGALWYFYSRKENAGDYAVYWILQDLFGACMCVLFLSVIRLPSLRVATFLLIAAFFYDIFFVFISPLVFNKSVMIHVATGGDGPTTDPMVCEK